MKTFKQFVTETTLDDVHALAKSKGVHLDLDKYYGRDDYHVSWIERGEEKGSGREVMNKLHDHADKHKKNIHLVAHESEPKLISYYKSMGYKKRGETDDGTYMVRKYKK